MRWRDVDSIPYGKPRGKLPKDKKYYAVPTVKQVNGIEYMVIDFVEKKKTFLRAAYRKTDFGLYWPEENERRGQRLTDYLGHIKATKGTLLGECLKDKVWMRDDDQEAVYQFCSGRSKANTQWRTWVGEIKYLESNVVYQRRCRKEEREQERMEKRIADTPDIPEAFMEYAKELLAGVGYLFYRKKDGRATVRCSRCGIEVKTRYRAPEGYEARFMHISEEPVDNTWGECECCGLKGIYKPIGRMKNEYDLQQACYLIQPFREKGIVLREIISEKVMSLERPEEIYVGERSRAYFLEGKSQTDWYVEGIGGSGWTYTNGGGMNPWKMNKGPVWPGSWRLIEKTVFGHSGCREYLMHFGNSYKQDSPVYYFGQYMRRNYLEMAVKNGLWELVDRVMHGYETGNIVPNPLAGKPADMLGIWPERLGMLKNAEGKISLLGILREERNSGKRMKEEQIRNLSELDLGAAALGHILQYMGIQRFMNRVAKYAGTEYGTECSCATAELHAIGRAYLDYLDMQAETGADMTDQIIQHPRNLQEEHDKLVTARNEAENRRKCEAKEAQFPDIRKKYRKLSRRYRYEADGMLIRPASSATEIIHEGQDLHHCVGGDTYLGKHDKGQTYILFLRAAKLPKAPYVTVEIDAKTNRILQWYGIRDTKPDRERVQAWLDSYVSLLRKYGDMATMRAAAEEAEHSRERLLVAAG